MKARRLFPALLALAITAPAYGQRSVDPVLNAASQALDHYEQIAPRIRCQDAATKNLRDSCKIALDGLEERVQQAKSQIAHYRQLPSPQAVDLFDTYEMFRRVMDVVESLNFAPDYYGEHNRALFAEAYNTFVKVTGWFGGVVRDTIQEDSQRRAHGVS